ncbi:hypothetical protein OEZ86_011221 [Tetradesmus obliquus]|nr:hypothetical protein OEZ86_011221 [Tetradesmus obliquus]
MASVSDDDFLAGLAPPSLNKGPTSIPNRRTTSDEAVPKTPPVASVSPTRRAAVDATSTLLNFLKQEQAIATDSLTKPNASPQEQGQPSSSNADSKQDAAVAIPSSTNTALTGRRATTPEAPASVLGGGRRATQGRPAAAAKSDSWDLDDELLPDGSTAKGAARVFNAMIADAQLAGCSGVPFLAGC